jgi:hypothetical protein
MSRLCRDGPQDRRGFRTVQQGARQAIKMTLIGPDCPTGAFTDEEGTVPW